MNPIGGDAVGNNTARPAITLAWQPEHADYQEAFRVRNRIRRVWRKITVLAGILVLVVVAGIAAGDPDVIGVGIGGIVAIVLVTVFLQPLAVRNAWRRNPAMRAASEVRVDPRDGVTSSNGLSTGQFAWAGIDGFIETDRLFLVQLGGYKRKPFLVLAKRGLADQTQLDDLRAMLAAATAKPA